MTEINSTAIVPPPTLQPSDQPDFLAPHEQKNQLPSVDTSGGEWPCSINDNDAAPDANVEHGEACVFSDGLPTKVREALCQRKLHQAARLLDIFYFYGSEPKQVVTEAMINELIQEWSIRMTKHTIGDILTAEIDHKRIFVRLAGTLVSHRIFTPKIALKRKNTLTLQKEGKKSRGRPSIWYIIPEPKQVASLLKIGEERSDIITEQDLISIKKYREAIHRELIATKPDEYSRYKLGSRLGIKGASTRQYDRDLGIKVERRQYSTALDSSNIDNFSWGKEAGGGAFLQDGNGKRYRPTREKAEGFIAVNLPVYYVVTARNRYSLPLGPQWIDWHGVMTFAV